MKLSLLIGCATLILNTAFCNPADADTRDRISVESEVDHAFATIGDRINYRLAIRHHPTIKILDINTQETLKDFELKEEKSFKEELEGGLISDGKQAIITNFSLGEYVLSPSIITYQDATGNRKETTSNKLYVSVESVDKSGQAATDIKGVKGVVGLIHRTWKWFLFLMIVVATGGGALWWFWIQKRKKDLAAQNASSLLSPHEEAYAALHDLTDSDLLKRGQYKLYFSLLSEIIKRYLERRFGFLALEATTQELMERLRMFELDTNVLALIKNVITLCDLVKFAKYLPIPSEVLTCNRQAKEMIDRTKQEIETSPLEEKGEPQGSDQPTT